MVEYRSVVVAPGYRVGDDGSVWSCRKKGPSGTLGNVWKQLNPSRNGDGYRFINVCNGSGKPTPKKIAPMVCEAFHGDRPHGYECRHLNGVCEDDRADNLRWGTKLENEADRKRHGTVPVGERHYNAKLTNAQVVEIRKLRGTMTQQRVSEMYGVTRANIGMIWGRKSRIT